MEELQDAIEDAQYMNAMHDGGPRPTKRWRWPSGEEYYNYMEEIKSRNPDAFEAQGLCKGILGFYMFMKFCGQQNQMIKIMTEFIEDVASYRAKSSSNSMIIVAEGISKTYLVEGSLGCKASERCRPTNIVRNLDRDSDFQKNKLTSPTNSFPRNREVSISSDTSVFVHENQQIDLNNHWSKYLNFNDDYTTSSTESVESCKTKITNNFTDLNNITDDNNNDDDNDKSKNNYKNDNNNNNRNNDNKNKDNDYNINCDNAMNFIINNTNFIDTKHTKSKTVINENFQSSIDFNSEFRSDPNSLISPIILLPTALKVKRINAIKFSGTPLMEIFKCLEENSRKNELNSMSGEGKISTNLFDEIDKIIFNYFVEAYFPLFKISPLWTRLFQFLTMIERKVVEEDFSLFRVLGRGGFGLVNACKRCTTGKLYAMKMLNKKRIKMKKAEALCLQERNILAIIHSPYVVCLKYAFSTPTDLYLILDLMTGGDLGYHLSRKCRFTVKETKYYAARTLLGLAAMHEKNIAFRDLKPENILMDEEGYTKISDLGLACKVGRSGLSGTCGTRGYWAPEMLRRDDQEKRERYTVSVDWFSFGCCVYEFMYGISPFRTDKARKWGDFPKTDKADRDKAIDLAIQQMDPDFDDHVFDDVAKDLIRQLLNKDGKLRLGANGYKEIIAHPWFEGIDWDNLSRSKPPMKPAKDINMATQSEIGAFSDEKLVKKVLLDDKDHKVYENWDFLSKQSFQEEIVESLLHEDVLDSFTMSPSAYGCCSIS